MKNKIEIIIAVILVLLGVFLYNWHEDSSRERYARKNNCEWVVSGSHDICRSL